MLGRRGLRARPWLGQMCAPLFEKRNFGSVERSIIRVDELWRLTFVVVLPNLEERQESERQTIGHRYVELQIPQRTCL